MELLSIADLTPSGPIQVPCRGGLHMSDPTSIRSGLHFPRPFFASQGILVISLLSTPGKVRICQCDGICGRCDFVVCL
jgi:hypothetical protein